MKWKMDDANFALENWCKQQLYVWAADVSKWSRNWAEIDVEWLQMDNMRNCSQTMFAHTCVKVERSKVAIENLK